MNSSSGKSFSVLLDSGQSLLHWQEACLRELSQEADFQGFHYLSPSDSPVSRDLVEVLLSSTVAGLKPSRPEPVAEVSRASKPDFLLSFSSQSSPPEWLEAPLGVWQYRFGGEDRLPGLYEHCYGVGVLESRLVSERLVNGKLVVRPLYHSRLKTDWHIWGTLGTLFKSCPTWAPQALQALEADCLPSSRQRPATGVGDIFRFTSDLLQRALRSVLWEWFGYDTWNVGLVHRSVEGLDDLDPRSAEYLPKHRPLTFLADPFFLPDGSLLVEECDHSSHSKGKIHRVVPSTEKLELDCVLEEKHHLSYPCLVQIGATLYCLPEAYKSGQLQLYRVTEQGLVPDRLLLTDIDALDPTLFYHKGLWWLFFSGREPQPSSRLFAYFAEDIEGPWMPHRLNPLKEDVGASRPAGQLFTVGDRLYRPAQDCCDSYGKRLIVHEIETLTPERFVESQALVLEADPLSPYPDGLHHLSIGANAFCFDAKIRRYDPLFPLRKMFL